MNMSEPSAFVVCISVSLRLYNSLSLNPILESYRMVLTCPLDPNTFSGSIWALIWGVKYLLRKYLDL